mmetsp:Transcript_111362/g.321950  ORF Transcript_111362/g.321950 Transcript_111362/m.321950 type:complete len:525 (+) Transcript_111362:117-1691(+)|eukprot:CAMPEP_0176171026 /NCGR_PEP_ID=MMETSP0120_2-20121206/87552_1 /TAXON_ID=160619 /ORGANISM="Kryptoperidinium foliaceum, Strain CCMP 1326" /LENGTH=524 /DNA_ID=CAMNT_0017508837 /DNA_START=65 /DNA_END=1639 /DNA_ORIENTATION=+
MTSALDRILNRPWDLPGGQPHIVDWRAVQRVTSRQSSAQTLMSSLERLSSTDCPLYVFESLLKRILEFPADPRQYSFSRCISHVWRFAFQIPERTPVRSSMLRASPQVASNILRIHTTEDLRNRHPTYYQAFQKTELLLRAMERCDRSENNHSSVPEPTTTRAPLVHILLQHHPSLFLILLAYRMDPTCLSTPDPQTGRLALHVAMNPHVRCSHRNALDGHQIGMPTLESLNHRPTSNDDDNENDEEQPTFSVEERFLLALLDRPSPIPLLCHWYPMALRKRDHKGQRPLETLLLGLGQLPQHRWWSLFPYTQFVLDFLEDVLAATRAEPTLLETTWNEPAQKENEGNHNDDSGQDKNANGESSTSKEPAKEDTATAANDNDVDEDDNVSATSTSSNHNQQQTGLKLFCLPMLHSSQRQWQEYADGEHFLLTLSYSLLKENPMVLQEYMTSHQGPTPFAPNSAYERILQDRIQKVQERKKELQSRQAELRRLIAEAQAEPSSVPPGPPKTKKNLPPRKRLKLSS